MEWHYVSDTWAPYISEDIAQTFFFFRVEFLSDTVGSKNAAWAQVIPNKEHFELSEYPHLFSSIVKKKKKKRFSMPQ